MTVCANAPTREHPPQSCNRAAKLYLASKSPRRRLMLNDAGIDHETIESGIDDGGMTSGDVSPEQWVLSLSYLKARAGFDRLPPNEQATATVLGADTVVVKNGELIGQPQDEADARRIIRLLQNGSHRVVTGVTLLDARGREGFTDSVAVRVGPLSDSQIDGYVASGNWRGKAGAYNLAERLTDNWPISYDGDPSTVMGLPMLRLLPMLRTRCCPGDSRG